MRDQRDQLSSALDALMQLERPPQDINTALATLRDTSVQLNDALQLADDLAAWCATFEASQTADTSGVTSQQAHVRHAPAWLERLQAWANGKQWPFSGHAPRWQVGMFNLEQVAPDMIELWLGDRQEHIAQLPADGHAITNYLDAFLTRPVPQGFVDALPTSIRTLAGTSPAAAVLEVLEALEQRLPDALKASMPDEQTYNRAAFAYDVFRVKTDANIRLVAASRAQKQRLWIPQDQQGRGMICGWLAC